MNQIELAQKFKKLARIMLEKVEKSPIKKADFQLEPYKVFVPDLRAIRYNNGKIEYFLKTIEKQKHDIDFEVKVPKFYIKFCVKLTEFKELQVILAEFLGIKEEHAGNLIKNFIYHLIHKSNRILDDNNLNHIIDKHIRSFEVRTPLIKTNIFLHGIWLDREQLQINENLKIRRIKSSDFETHSPEILKQQFGPFGNFPYVVLKYKIPLNLEIKNLSQLQIEHLKKVRLLIYAFLLFRFGSVFSNKCILPILRSNNPNTIFQAVTGFGYSGCHADFTKGRMIHLNPHLFIGSRHTYVISESDLTKINDFIAILSKSDKGEVLFPGLKKSNYIIIALNRYQNAFLNAENLESQISYAISCLEALFSKSQGNLQRKLGQRISIIFRMFGFNPLIMNDIIRRAYNVRSKYSHGVVTNVKHEKLEKLSRSVLQCARISLLFFLQIDSSLKKKMDIVPLNKKEFGGTNEKMNAKARKNFLIKILDNTLIDERSYEGLQKFIQKRFQIFL